MTDPGFSAPMTAPQTAASHPDSERLAKLWEAYRVQEEEYKEAVARLERMTTDLENRDAAAAERERVILEKEREAQKLQQQIAERDARIAELQELEKEIDAVQAYKDRIAQLEAAYAQEKERLAKLFLLYEEATRAK
jgi:uncharacterized protein (DUF3084 family)